MIEQEVIAQEYGHVVLVSRADQIGATSEGVVYDIDLVRNAIASCPSVQETPEHLRIVVEIGDTVAVIFFGGAAFAGLTAQYLFETLHVDAEHRLRIACHSDMIKRRRTKRGNWQVSGIGIDRARKILSWCDGTSVVCSETFVENLRPLEPWVDKFKRPEEKELSPGKRLVLFQLDTFNYALTLEPNPEGVYGLHQQRTSNSDLIQQDSPNFVSSRPQGNLPEDELKFHGREREVAEVVDAIRVQKERLVSITGMGGMGKTRLGRQVARELTDDFKEGVYLIECDSLTKSFEVLFAIASTLNLGTCSTVSELAESLGNQRILLLIDCFERIVDGGSMLEELTRGTKNIHILLTSRVVLGLPREYEYPLGPMRRVGGEDGPSELFWEIARKVSRHLTRSPEAEEIVDWIIESIQGVPLAIVLAASRLRALALGDLKDQLVHRQQLSVLRRTRSGERDRQYDLVRVIKDSFDLLGEEEQGLICDLSIFSGFSLEDAYQILKDRYDVDLGITRLRENSLLVAVSMDNRMRYRMLDSVREFIQTEVKFHPEMEVIHRYSQHYAKHAARVRSEIESGGWGLANGALWVELGNYRRGIGYAVAEKDVRLLSDYAAALARPFAEADLHDDFETLTQPLFSLGSVISSTLRIELLGLEGMRCRRRNDVDEAFKNWWERARICLTEEDWDRFADSLTDICDLGLAVDREDQAQEALVQYDSVATRFNGEGPIFASGCILHGRFALKQGDYSSAKEYAERALAAPQVSEDHPVIYIKRGAADILDNLEETDRAKVLRLEALSVSAKGSYWWSARRLLLDLNVTARTTFDLDSECSTVALLLKLPVSQSLEIRTRIQNARKECVGRWGSQVFNRISRMFANQTADAAILTFCANSVKKD